MGCHLCECLEKWDKNHSIQQNKNFKTNLVLSKYKGLCATTVLINLNISLHILKINDVTKKKFFVCKVIYQFLFNNFRIATIFKGRAFIIIYFGQLSLTKFNL